MTERMLQRNLIVFVARLKVKYLSLAPSNPILIMDKLERVRAQLFTILIELHYIWHGYWVTLFSTVRYRPVADRGGPGVRTLLSL